MRLSILTDSKGKVLGVDKTLLNQLPFFLLSQPPDNRIVVSANQSSEARILSVSGDGPIAITAIGIESTGACLVSFVIQDGQTPRALMNSPVRSSIMSGTNGKPYYLPTPLVVPELGNITVNIIDTSGSQNTVAISLWGAKYTSEKLDLSGEIAKSREAARQYLTMPYIYTMLPSNTVGAAVGALRLSALGSSEQALNVGMDHHFQLLTISAASTGAFTLNLQDAQTGESMMLAPQSVNYAIRNSLVCGNGEFPLRLPYPRTFRRGTKILATLTDLSNDNNDVYLALGGCFIADRLGERAQ